MKRFREFLCRRWGHTIDPIDGAMFLAEVNAIDCQSGLAAFPDVALKCKRCGEVLLTRDGKVE